MGKTITMETTEVLHYKWCIWENPLYTNVAYTYVKDLNQNLLVYCKVEKRHNVSPNGINLSSSICTVPVTREEMEVI